MDDRVTNLIYDLFIWFGRVGRIQFIVTGSALILFMWLSLMLDARSSLQSIAFAVIGWCWLMQFIKRGHDFGAPAWMSMLICFASFLVVPVSFWAVMPGDDTPNKYGVRRV